MQGRFHYRPARPGCLPGEHAPAARLPDAVRPAALTLTRTRQAHAAAVQHAAATEALRDLEAEALATRYRLRAIEDRWIPRLEQPSPR